MFGIENLCSCGFLHCKVVTLGKVSTSFASQAESPASSTEPSKFRGTVLGDGRDRLLK